MKENTTAKVLKGIGIAIMALCFIGAWGVGITEELNEALQTAFQTQLYQLGLVKTGGNKRGFLKSEKRLGEAEIAALKKVRT